MSYWDRLYGKVPDFPQEQRPNFHDLQANTEAGFIRRGLARYFTPRNYERSIKLHTCLGSPLIRKVVMGTAGRLHHSDRGVIIA